MFDAVVRAAERWRAIKVTEFERRQMTALKKEFDQESGAEIGLDAKASKDDVDQKRPSTARTWPN